MDGKILIFGGTTEGRELAEMLLNAGIPHVVSVATEYGKEIELENGEDSLLVGRKTSEDMTGILSSGAYSLVVDATHPFATRVSEEIMKACRDTDIEYLRLSRPRVKWREGKGIIRVSTVEEAARELEKVTGNILILTGSRDLKELLEGIGDISRVYVRVLPSIDSISKCQELGLTGKQIIAMQGPFSRQMNEALIKEVGAFAILTKESGTSGGFMKKLEAARALGVKCVVIENPEKDNKAFGMEQVLERIEEVTGRQNLNAEKTIVLAGKGPGRSEFWTGEFKEALDKADIVFGAGTVLMELRDHVKICGIEETDGSNDTESGCSSFAIDHRTIPAISVYDPDDICRFLDEHPGYQHPMVVYSGDIALCSGAKRGEIVFADKGYKVMKISGISSVALFANRLSLSLEHVMVVSAHGRKCNVNGYVRENEHLIVLPSGAADAARIVRELDGGCMVIAGLNLGLVDDAKLESAEKTRSDMSYSERIFEVEDPSELESATGKVLLYINNPASAKRKIGAGLRDNEITRGNVPMTKEDIRALSIRRLGLTKGAVLWDVGAGTGSISLEAALLDPTIEVFSVEKKAEAAELLKENREKFGVCNMYIVEGEAPEALTGLPAPDSVFVGGSGKHLEEILLAARNANPQVRVVVNCVTLETMSETIAVLDKLEVSSPEIIQVSVSRYEKRGSYHMADAQNPVFIISF